MAGRRQQATHTADRHRLCDPVERVRPQVFQGKGALHQPCRHGANHHRIGRGETLEPRRDVGRFAKRQVLVPPTTAHHPHHDRAGVDAEPHGELDAVLCRQTGIQGGDGLDNAQAGVHRAPGIVFMGCGVAKIDQQPIAEILGDMALVVLNDLGRGLLVGAHHRAQVFGVELAGELRGAHQVTEQHRELPPFRLRGRADRRCGQHRHRIRRCARCLDRRVCWLGGPAVGHDDARQAACPDQPSPCVIDYLRVRIEEFLLEDRQVSVVQVKLELQRVVGNPPVAMEPGEGLVEHGEKVSLHLAALLVSRMCKLSDLHSLSVRLLPEAWRDPHAPAPSGYKQRPR